MCVSEEMDVTMVVVFMTVTTMMVFIYAFVSGDGCNGGGGVCL